MNVVKHTHDNTVEILPTRICRTCIIILGWQRTFQRLAPAKLNSRGKVRMERKLLKESW